MVSLGARFVADGGDERHVAFRHWPHFFWRPRPVIDWSVCWSQRIPLMSAAGFRAGGQVLVAGGGVDDQ